MVFDGGTCVGEGMGCADGAVGVALTVEGVGLGAGGEVAMFWLARFPVTGPGLDGLAGPAGELAAADVGGWLLDAGGGVPAAEGWLLVQAASMNASATIELAEAVRLA